MLLPLLIVACDAGTDSATEAGEEAVQTPVIAFVTPTDGATVPCCDIDVSVSVEHFALASPEHNEGLAEGYVEISWSDVYGSDSVQASTTTTTIHINRTGGFNLVASLYFADGDEVTGQFSDFVPAEIGITVTL